MSTWKALVGRISFLASAPTPPPETSVLDLYKQTWGTNPQNFQDAPNPLMPSTAQGVVDGMTVACTKLPNRVDFSVTPNTTIPTADLSIRFIEDASTLRGELSRIAAAIAANQIIVPEMLNRVAVFIQFVAIEPDLVSANKAVSRAIPRGYGGELSDEEAFVLQFSRSQALRDVPKVKLNVLTKWSVEQFQVVSFGVSFGVSVGGVAGENPQTGIVPQVRSYIGASVSFDCNTPPTRETLVGNERSALILEALNIASRAQLEYGLNVEGFDRVSRKAN